MANNHLAATRRMINQLDNTLVETPNRCTIKVSVVDKKEARAREVKNAKNFLLLSAFTMVVSGPPSFLECGGLPPLCYPRTIKVGSVKAVAGHRTPKTHLILFKLPSPLIDLLMP